MANPVLNERSLQAASQWAPPAPGTEYTAPIDDGPVSPWPAPTVGRAMTVNGVISATATLLVVLVASAALGWWRTPTVELDGQTFVASIPMLAWVGLVVGIGLTFLLMFKPLLARVIAPIYAIAEGFFIGAISKAYETVYDGIVVQAAGAAIAVFAVMLFLYRMRIIRVTERFRSVIVAATMGVMVFYGISLLIRLFAGPGSIAFLHSPSLLGIGFSVLVSALAAFNLVLDFDFIERGAQQRLDRSFEWFAAFGLLVTIIWLYLELLRLLAKLRER